MRKCRKLIAGLLSVSILIVNGTNIFADHNSIGSYQWSVEPDRHKAYEKWLGREETYILDFCGDESWYSIAEPYWLTSVWKKTDYKDRMVFSIPMLPKIEGVSLEKGANGEYDYWFKTLGQHLVTNDLENSIIRIGWEMNGGWYKWAAGGQEENYAEFFRRIVTAMRSVEGGNFKFFWNPAIGYLSANTEKCYPGNDYVDYIGLDVYDECWADDTYPIPEGASEVEMTRRRAKAFISLKTRQWGLNWLTSFGRENGKKIIIGEWGTDIRADNHGGGDNPLFVRLMHDWFEDNEDIIAGNIYFDVTAPDGDHCLSGISAEGTKFPLAAEMFKKLWETESRDEEQEAPPEEPAVQYIVNDDLDNITLGELPSNSSWVKWVENGGKSEFAAVVPGGYYTQNHMLYKDEDGVYVRSVNAQNGNKLYTALYDVSGRLTRVTADTISNDIYGIFEQRCAADDATDINAKAFIWRDFLQPAGKVVSENVAELEPAGRCIRLTGVKANSMQAKAKRNFTAKSGIVTAEASVRVDKGVLYGPYIGDSSNNDAIEVQIKANEEIIHSPGGEWKSLYPCNAGRSYKIKAVIDTNAKTYDIYVDGYLLNEAVPLKANVSTVSFISFTFWDDGIAYIDDVKVY